MKLSNALQDAMNFAYWCDNNGIDPHKGSMLIRSVRRYNNLAVRDCNGEDVNKKLDRAADMVEKDARLCGFLMVRYDGLWPTFCKKNSAGDWYDVHLPGIAMR